MTAILGISAFYHDSAAALVVDGRIVAAAQEERFTRVKNDHRFPAQAVDYCLAEAGLQPPDLDYVAFYDKPLLKFERLLETYLDGAPRGACPFIRAMPPWLKQKLHLPREIGRQLGGGYRKRYVFAEHHQSHAASAFFPSPFEEAALLTLDGVGEWATACCGYGRRNKIQLTHELRFPHSLGLLYSAFTYYCGFEVNSAEYKLMGLAPYGQPMYAKTILQNVIDLKPDGSFRMAMPYFNYCHGLTMTSRRLNRLLGGPPRKPDATIDQRYCDIAASIQRVTEQIMLRAARHIHRQTGMKNLCLAGGAALNCVANGRILREGPFENLWIQPAAGDAGAALGVALFLWHQLLDRPRTPRPTDSQSGSLLGPKFTDHQIGQFLDRAGANYQRIPDDHTLCGRVARLLAQQKVVGWFHGRMEFGPRALGNRSILADPRSGQMQAVINRKIKFREPFRPLAPSVLQEAASDYFQMPPNQPSPYMLLVAPVQTEKRIRPNRPRSEVPAITHVDHSARVQTVDHARHGRFHELIEAFANETGCPLVVNTSFNVRGEPIVCTPKHAYDCFMATDIDVLVLERFLLLKTEQPTPAPPVEADNDLTHPARKTTTAPRAINQNPQERELKAFARIVLPALLGLVAALVLLRGGSWAVAGTLWSVAALVAGVGLARPRAVRPLYVAWRLLVAPIGWTVSRLLLAAVFFLVLTPIGLAMRLAGRKRLDTKLDRNAKTYWLPRSEPNEPSRYFRQF